MKSKVLTVNYVVLLVVDVSFRFNFEAKLENDQSFQRGIRLHYQTNIAETSSLEKHLKDQLREEFWNVDDKTVLKEVK